MPASAVTVTASFVPADQTTPAPTPAAKGFVDVPADAYYAAPVDWAVDKGVTNGVDDTHFAPDATVDRAQSVTFLYRLSGEKTGGENPFADVSEGAYYYDAVLLAVSEGVTNGTSANAFSPNANCTRGQIVTLLYRSVDKV